jgi:hypothetical protein
MSVRVAIFVSASAVFQMLLMPCQRHLRYTNVVLHLIALALSLLMPYHPCVLDTADSCSFSNISVNSKPNLNKNNCMIQASIWGVHEKKRGPVSRATVFLSLQ